MNFCTGVGIVNSFEEFVPVDKNPHRCQSELLFLGLDHILCELKHSSHVKFYQITLKGSHEQLYQTLLSSVSL